MSRKFAEVQGDRAGGPREREDSVLEPAEGHPLSPRGVEKGLGGDPSVRAALILAAVLGACVIAVLLIAVL
jgi:hypothetical protein